MKRLFTFFLLIFLSISILEAQPIPKQKNPKLVVGIVIDQFRFDYLDRFSMFYLPATETSGGFNRLLQHGALMSEARYTYSHTLTAPGHATFFSGKTPSHSAIIGNDWYSRSEKKNMYCVEDQSVRAVGIDSSSSAGKMSPKNYLSETVGDKLKSVSPKSKVIGISIKDRGAILPAGQKANAAFWFDSGSGKFISSSYYFKDGNLPAWTDDFNSKKIPESYIGKSWEKLLPDNAYLKPDDAQGEGNLLGEDSPVFPHKLADISSLSDPRLKKNKRYEVIAPTPYGNDLTIEFAKSTITGEQLGQRNVTDILTVSFSSPDYCGHTFGPDSEEQQDLIIRLDRQLDGFFKYIDEKIGFDNCVFVLSADHGVQPLPEQVKGAQRVSGRSLEDSIRTAVNLKYPNVIESIMNLEIYLDYSVIKKMNYNQREVESFVGETSKKLTGIADYVTRTELADSSLQGVKRMIANSFYSDRCGDVFLVESFNTLIFERQKGTSHGSIYDYDTHVPILFTGRGIKGGRYKNVSAPIDIAPTIHALLGLPKKNTAYYGRILKEILK